VATPQTEVVPRFTLPLGSTARRLAAPAALAIVVALPLAASAKDGGGEVRAAVCSKGVTSELRLRSDSGSIEVRFKLRRGRASTWRVVLVQERRVAWKGTQKATGTSGSFELRRSLPDLAGADAVTATAWGPQGLVCRASATLPDAPADGSGSKS
jgi:hypothetical protein